MTPTKADLILALLGLLALIVGWWMVFRTEKVHQYFGNPVFSRTPLMASLNRVHSQLFGSALMLGGIIVAAKAIMRFLHIH